MKIIPALSFVFAFSLLSIPSIAHERTSSPILEKPVVVNHGGGCRKSSPPGQCCHMETKTGVVHCH